MRERGPSSRLEARIAAAAAQGILAGLSGCSSQPSSMDVAEVSVTAAPATASVATTPLERAPPVVVADARKHEACCKGRNECKGKGNCKVEGRHDCAGKNDCKGLGGCAHGPNCTPASSDRHACGAGTCAANPATGHLQCHACAGKNSCKGLGGCLVRGRHTCKGQNACKGLGGCAAPCPSPSGGNP